MSDEPVIQSRCADLSQEAEIERLRGDVSDYEKAHELLAEVNNCLRGQLAEARELLERVADHGIADDAPELYADLWAFLRPDAATEAPPQSGR
jgi:hypothetical protein